ncbi:DUF397 domain-containing protein [Streptomyces sp. B6B3]|jgi:hypothetical protein|uniref:DUF397 domain-containing protein n=1 Tax=Streptomyces sp. B6B3 TaxID=3153570 RepID=UPI00325EB861
MRQEDLTPAEWIKSSYSASSGGECVEFSRVHLPSGVVPVRDAKAPEGPSLTFPPTGWASFVTAVQRNELAA